jgi:hypothetical protein
MSNTETAEAQQTISIHYSGDRSKHLADFIKWDLEWLLEMKIANAEPLQPGSAHPGINQVTVTIMLSPFMRASWRAVIHSMKRGLTKSACGGIGGRLILTDMTGAMMANFLFQGYGDMVGIGDSMKVMMAT